MLESIEIARIILGDLPSLYWPPLNRNDMMIQARPISLTDSIQPRPGVIPWAHLFAPMDIASLAAFRVAFGAILVWEVLRYAQFGWILPLVEPG